MPHRVSSEAPATALWAIHSIAVVTGVVAPVLTLLALAENTGVFVDLVPQMR